MLLEVLKLIGVETIKTSSYKNSRNEKCKGLLSILVSWLRKLVSTNGALWE